jgi:hypothetical protein
MEPHRHWLPKVTAEIAAAIVNYAVRWYDAARPISKMQVYLVCKKKMIYVNFEDLRIV